MSKETQEFNMALGEFTRLLIDGRKATVDVVECICYLPISPVLRRFDNKKQELSGAGVDTTEYWVDSRDR